MTQNNRTVDGGMARISISEDGSSPPTYRTSRTPPPPGFDGPPSTTINGSLLSTAATNSTSNNSAVDRAGTPNTCKSTSFNNLAMALGTGLAECMDDSTSGEMAGALQFVKPPQRIHTPDTYTRQSRHSVSRLMGSSASGGVGVGAGGFDYMNPGGTSHVLIPPVNNSYLNKLKAGGGQQQHQMLQQQHQQQRSAGNGEGLGNQVSGGLDNNNGRLFTTSTQQQQNQQQGGSSLAQAMDQNKPVRFTAAMMANARSGGGGATSDAAAFQLNNNSQGAAGNNNEVSSPILSSTNSHHLNRDLLRQQLLLQQSAMNNGGNNNNYSRANSNPIGIVAEEPSSTRNSPAPQRASMIGMNGDGLLYPVLQQQQHQQLHSMGTSTPGRATGGSGNNDLGTNHHNTNLILSNERDDFLLANGAALAGHVPNFAASAGGRASAPPPRSQPVAGPFPGGMTTAAMNNAAIRAYAASSLQMRVAELHQELGGGGGGANRLDGGARRAAPPPGTVLLRVLTPAPTPPPPGMVVAARPPSRGGGTPDPLLNKHITRSSTPGSGSTITNVTPNPTVIVVGNQHPHQHQHQHQPMQTMMATTPPYDPERHERERAAVRELTPFLRDPPSKSSNSSSSSSSGGGVSTRGLAILYASSLPVPDVRSTCEAFGALESFRSDFGESRGVFFATFYDLRSAQLAVGELPKALNRIGSSTGGGNGSGGNGVQVKYCVPLNSCSATDESMLMLSNLPGTVDEQDLNHVLSSFGEVRAIHYQASIMSETEDEEDGSETTSYLVEFYDVQDARQALLELEQTNPWAEKTKVKVGTRSPTKRKQGKDLILLMSCWRQGVVAPMKGGENNNRQSPQQPESVGNTLSPTPSPSPPQPVVMQQQHQQQQLQQHDISSSQTTRTSHVHHQQQHQTHHMEINQNISMGSSTQSYYQQYPNHHQAVASAPGHLQQYQLVVGPDGQYSYVLVNHPHHPLMVGHHPYGQMGQMVIDPHHQHQQQQQQQHIMYVDQHYQMHNPHQLNMNMNPAAAVQQQQYHIQYNGGVMPGTNYHVGMPTIGQTLDAAQQPPTPYVRMPSNDFNSSSLSSGSQSPCRRKAGASARTGKGGSVASIGSGSSGGNNSGGHNSAEADQENHNLSLNVDHVRTGEDRRSSLMVRNIPNKYTQAMLLSEFASSGHGSTKMDFFYLPIDFKNKCNRGYAFVNFVDYKDICAFVEEYNGTSWRRFNSEKICDITYARIQGKAAMLKRFENSALMEKEGEYRPKVFVSHGERKGEVESMPMMGGGSGGGAIP